MTIPSKQNPTKRVLVLGGYGFIGAHLMRFLQANNYNVTALGRNAHKAKTTGPDWPWILKDLADLDSAEKWHPILRDVDSVLNCSGALQATPRDNLDAVQDKAISALAEACAKSRKQIIQISAVGANHEAPTDFMQSKARGDAAIVASGASYCIFKPGLVLAQNAYGGSNLIRMLAATPLIQPVALQSSKIQTVSIQDIYETTIQALEGTIPSGSIIDLVEDQSHSLENVILKTRSWLGFSQPASVVKFPKWTVRISAYMADILGKLGWRSPLRTNAIKVLQNGVLGDPAPLRQITGASMKNIDETYSALHATAEHRQYSRFALLMPFALAALCLFWGLSGIIGLWQLDEAAIVLTKVGWPSAIAKASVVFWSFVDIVLAAMLLWRPFAQRACIGMIIVSVIYLLSASVFTPAMWADPLGPMVKVLPSIFLAFSVHIMLEER